MKKSEMYRLAQVAILSHPTLSLTNGERLDIIKLLMEHETLEQWREERDEKTDKEERIG